jgi:hypothetical protein
MYMGFRYLKKSVNTKKFFHILFEECQKEIKAY